MASRPVGPQHQDRPPDLDLFDRGLLGPAYASASAVPAAMCCRPTSPRSNRSTSGKPPISSTINSLVTRHSGAASGLLPYRALSLEGRGRQDDVTATLCATFASILGDARRVECHPTAHAEPDGAVGDTCHRAPSSAAERRWQLRLKRCPAPTHRKGPDRLEVLASGELTRRCRRLSTPRLQPHS